MKAHLSSLCHNVHDTTLLLTLAIWLCALPFLLLVTVPFIGWELGVLFAAIVLFIVLLVCYAVCYFPKIVPL